jgi:hypothetical protein
MKPLEDSMSAQQPLTSPELYGPYLHAPVLPWQLAGWTTSALFVLWFVIARVLA